MPSKAKQQNTEIEVALVNQNPIKDPVFFTAEHALEYLTSVLKYNREKKISIVNEKMVYDEKTGFKLKKKSWFLQHKKQSLLQFDMIKQFFVFKLQKEYIVLGLNYDYESLFVTIRLSLDKVDRMCELLAKEKPTTEGNSVDPSMDPKNSQPEIIYSASIISESQVHQEAEPAYSETETDEPFDVPMTTFIGASIMESEPLPQHGNSDIFKQNKATQRPSIPEPNIVRPCFIDRDNISTAYDKPYESKSRKDPIFTKIQQKNIGIKDAIREQMCRNINTDEWEENTRYISYDPIRGAHEDEEGPIIMYTGRSVVPKMRRAVYWSSDESYSSSDD